MAKYNSRNSAKRSKSLHPNDMGTLLEGETKTHKPIDPDRKPHI